MKRAILLSCAFSFVFSKKGCGQPGIPVHGRIILKRDGFLLTAHDEYLRDDEVVYSCDAGHTLLGSHNRHCDHDGSWFPDMPTCELNLAASNQDSLQSITFGNYTSNLATDGDKGTCAIIDRTNHQRWWQLRMDKKIQLKDVKLHLANEPLIAVTVFIIEISPQNKTFYNLCGRFERSVAREPRYFVTDDESRVNNRIRLDDDTDNDSEIVTIDVSCDNKDAVGHQIFVRDDRKKEDYFKVCEVEVFAEKQEESECGEPELSFGSFVAEESKNRDDKKVVYCKDGLIMIDGGSGEDINTNIITCSHGSWNSSHIKCESRKCPELGRPENGNLVVQFDDYDVVQRARVVCDPGHVSWGHTSVSCHDGTWSSDPATCRPLSCGQPPIIEHASLTLSNGSTLWRDEATYTCHHGYIMVVNDSSAQKSSVSVCSDSGDWSKPGHIKCVDASQLGGGGYLSDSARISINIIYCLLALLIIMSVPLLLFYCCGRKCKKQTRNKSSSSQPPEDDQMSLKTVNYDSGVSSGSSLALTSSPKVGIYSVSSGKVIQPATVSPNTLRSLSSVSANTFKPFSYTAQPPQPSSLPFNNWPRKERNVTRSSLQIQFDSPCTTLTHDTNEPKQEPIIDEAGYASLIIKHDPVYEPVQDLNESKEDSSVISNNLYDDVPAGRDHNYANLTYPVTVESSASFPDLLQMVTTTKSNDQERDSSDSVDNLYAKVDLSRKRSRPNSCESGDVSVTKRSLDSYTKTLIEKFNLFLEQDDRSNQFKS